ncbi:MAG: metallophosphoesterase family protein [Gemmatimonadetes bacterium]|nr:metallophosphoesterase family protein [Gemmatimonadota bacterium]
MRFALISDIHANLPALDAVLADIAARSGVDATYHLGDLVGYAPWPDETVARLRSERIHGVAGNYDSTVATRAPHCGCRYEDPKQEALSHQSYAWTLAHTSPQTKAYLAGLPFRIDVRPLGGHVSGPTVTLIHGNQVLNTVYVHAQRPDEFLGKMGESVGARGGDIVCFGHTHVPWHRQVDGVHFVNTGSVGRPKDGDPRAGYVLLDVADGQPVRMEIVRVSYDVEAAARAILASTLPDEFAGQLRTGGIAAPATPPRSPGGTV